MLSICTRAALSLALWLGLAIVPGNNAYGYEKPVHLSLTIWLAVTAGFSEADAFQLGRFDQATDDDWATTPLNPFHVKERGLYHAFDGPSAVRKLEAQANCTGGTRGTITASQFKRIGHYLHALEDQFSHRFFGPKIGQLLVGDGPDKPWYAPRDFVEMVNRKFEKLLELRRKCKSAPLAEIDAARNNFARVKDAFDRWASDAFEFAAEDDGNQGRWDDLARALYGVDYVKYTDTYVKAYDDGRQTPPTPRPAPASPPTVVPTPTVPPAPTGR